MEKGLEVREPVPSGKLRSGWPSSAGCQVRVAEMTNEEAVGRGHGRQLLLGLGGQAEEGWHFGTECEGLEGRTGDTGCTHI